jgi:vancomycin permeability regulator SanA
VVVGKDSAFRSELLVVRFAEILLRFAETSQQTLRHFSLLPTTYIHFPEKNTLKSKKLRHLTHTTIVDSHPQTGVNSSMHAILLDLRKLRPGLLRGVLLFFGVFTLANLIGERFVLRFDGTYWWINLPHFTGTIRTGLLILFSAASIIFVLRSPQRPWPRRALASLFLLFGLIATWNGIVFYILLIGNHIRSTIAPFPLSWMIAAVLFAAGFAVWRGVNLGLRNSLKGIALGFASTLLLFPLFQMLAFGKTDYSRQADAAVVPGARVYADGHLSDALQDRVQTGCQLYTSGLVRKLIFSGGPGDGLVDEPDAMKSYAIQQFGIPEKDIILDHGGLNTQATVQNTTRILAENHLTTVLCVSHFYHLPRLKLAFERANVSAFTVPAREHYILGKMPLFMAREIAALVKYYFHPL